jgi:hypothetical protein
VPDVVELLQRLVDGYEDVKQRLERMERFLCVSVVKEAYAVEDVAERVERTPWTVRQWCNQGRVQAKKVPGRGRQGEWRIPHDEVVRLQAEGPKPPGTFDNERLSRIAS